MKLFPVIFALFIALFALSPRPALAGFENIDQTVTIASGAASTSITVPFKGVKIRDVIVHVPAIDATDTATLGLRQSFNANSLTYTPRGWTDKAVANAETNAVVKANASELSIIGDSTVVIWIWCKTTQSAARTFTYKFLVEN